MTLSALGIFSAAGATQPSAAAGYELIATTILGSTTTTIDFTGLSAYSADYKHLQIRYSSKSTATGRGGNMRLNNITTTSYAAHTLSANSATVSSSNGTSATSISLPNFTTGSSTANAFSGGIIDILDAYSTTKNTTVRCLYGVEDGSGYITFTSGLFSNTAAIDSILFTFSTFAVNTRFSIYGIR